MQLNLITTNQIWDQESQSSVLTSHPTKFPSIITVDAVSNVIPTLFFLSNFSAKILLTSMDKSIVFSSLAGDLITMFIIGRNCSPAFTH